VCATRAGHELPPSILLLVLAHIVFTGARVTTSLYALANGASTFTVGVLMALFALVPMLTAVRAGKWLDRVGPKKPLVTSCALILLGIVLPAAFPYQVADLGPLLVGVALIGTGQMLTAITVQGPRRTLGGAGTSDDRLFLACAWHVGVRIRRAGQRRFIIDTLGHRAAFCDLFARDPGADRLALPLVADVAGGRPASARMTTTGHFSTCSASPGCATSC